MGENMDITKLEILDLIEVIQNNLFDGLADKVVTSVDDLFNRRMIP